MFLFISLLLAIVCIGVWQQLNNSRIIKLALKQHQKIIHAYPNFMADKVFVHPKGLNSIAIDNINHLVLVAKTFDRKPLRKAIANDKEASIITPKLLKYEDVIRAEVVIDGQNVSSKSASGALVGGLLFGTPGAIVGSNTGTTKYRRDVDTVLLKLLVKDVLNPAHEIVFFKKGFDRVSPKKAQINCQDWQDTLAVMTSLN